MCCVVDFSDQLQCVGVHFIIVSLFRFIQCSRWMLSNLFRFLTHSGTPVASVTTSQPTGPVELNSPMAAPPCSPPSDGSSPKSSEPSTPQTLPPLIPSMPFFRPILNGGLNLSLSAVSSSLGSTTRKCLESPSLEELRQLLTTLSFGLRMPLSKRSLS